MPTRRNAILASWLIVGLLAAGGCGGGSDSPDATASIPGSGAGDTAKSNPAAPAGDPLRPVVAFETSLGTIKVRLDGENARLTVSNFLSYVDGRHYDETIFHQVYQGQGVVGGGYTVNFEEKPVRPPVRNEADNGLRNRRGTIAMLRSVDAIDSAQAQFFFNLADNAALDHKDRTPEGYGYCVFGEVVEGLDVLDKIGATQVTDNEQFDHTPVQPIVIRTARRVR